ncbi:hypothetical protein [Fibrella forsythiae]|uniref:Uncharacterized protein n=1 Tax=Fibrella forsythiae TaxID=2817061 RepID=A0ABS3JBI0_9BACT|nr:hypothetical protein [Fibrella forsythiae]MBO0947340.1 hypothetical protein [Fibrella forsythiae]
MAKEVITVKVTPETIKAVRLIAALTEEKQYEVLERLAVAERDRLQPPPAPIK